MPETLSWSVKVSSSAGPAMNDSGSLTVPAVLSSRLTVDAATPPVPPATTPTATATTFTFQIDDVTKVAVLAVKSSVYDGKVSIKGAAGTDPEVALKGPVFVVGAAVEEIATDLTSLTVTNRHTEAATLDILIGLNVT